MDDYLLPIDPIILIFGFILVLCLFLAKLKQPKENKRLESLTSVPQKGRNLSISQRGMSSRVAYFRGMSSRVAYFQARSGTF